MDGYVSSWGNRNSRNRADIVSSGTILDFGQITCSYEQYLNGFARFEAVPDSAYRITLGFDVNGILAKLPSYSSNGHPAMSQLWREACSVSVCEFRHSGQIGRQHPKFVQSPKL
jgi:hypothetical protein